MVKKLQNAYRRMNGPAKAALWFTLCSVFQKGIQFLVIPVYTRLMSAEQYGEYSVFLSYYDFISIFATLNLSYYVVNNGMIRYENKKEDFITSLQGLGICSSILLFIIYLPFRNLWENFTGLSFAVMAVMFMEFLVKPSYDLWCQRLRFEYQYRPVVCLTIILWILIPGLSIPLIVFTQEKGISAIYGRTIASIIVFMVAFILIIKKSRTLFHREYWRFALNFNIPLLPHFISGMILNQADRIMIDRMCGSDKAGIYSLAYSVSVVTQIVNTAIHSSFIPYTYQNLKKGVVDGIKKIASQLVLLIACINLCMVLIAPELIKILGTEEYGEARFIVPPVAISVLFIFLFNLFVNIEYYYGENRFVPVASILSAVVNVVLNKIFIDKFGFIAAGYTTLFTYILYAAGHYIFMRRVSRKYLKGIQVYNTKIIWGISGVSVLLSMGILLIYDYWYLRYGILLATLAAGWINRDKVLKILKTGGKGNENGSVGSY